MKHDFKKGGLYKSNGEYAPIVFKEDTTLNAKDIMRIYPGDIAMVLDTGYKSDIAAFVRMVKILLKGRIGYIYEVYLDMWDCLT